MPTREQSWEFWIDRGGTFTDVVARRSDGLITVKKLLSQSPLYGDAGVQGMRHILGVATDDPLPSQLISAIKLGTTVSTNALLERKGEPVALITTKGFRDALRIGYQNRQDIFARKIVLPEQLYDCVVEADERVTVNGVVECALDESRLRSALTALHKSGMRACAIVFMHGYRYPAHEQLAARLAEELGFEQISCSHEVSPLIKFVTRGETAVVDAYLSPVLERYVEQFKKEVGETPVLFMQSNGGLIESGHFKGRNSLLSGPAGGVVGAVKTCAEFGMDKVIAFDMGGTSTDVSHYNGAYERRLDNVVAGFRIRVPMMDIHTVAAGGGSIVEFRSGRLQVGPQSAGAMPGPACYRNGGPLTVTDCNFYLGRIQEKLFPNVFGPRGDAPLDRQTTAHLLERLTQRVNLESSMDWTPERLAENFLAIAVEKMANAIKKVSIERGHNIADYALCSFGGAGGQHACKIAEALGLKTVVIHPFAGVLSAVGIGLSELRVVRQRWFERKLQQSVEEPLIESLRELEAEAVLMLSEQGLQPEAIETKKTVLIRYEGTDFSMQINHASAGEMERNFRDEHLKRYGFTAEDKDLILEAVMVESCERERTLGPTTGDAHASDKLRDGDAIESAPIFFNGKWRQSPVFDRDNLKRGQVIDGPALIVDPSSTTVVEPGWRAAWDERSYLRLQQHATIESDAATDSKCDPARLELFHNLFTAIAEEMGLQLQTTSHSVNIKERLDFSCAIFDGSGRLIANAPHIPVHLGSMGESIQSLVEAHGADLKSGDSFALNNPFNGGTHLPDITVMNPVFDREGSEVLFFVASRGHHADIGGITPGSMPPSSTTLEEEGVVIDNFLLVRDGHFREVELVDLLRNTSLHPARNTVQNVADMRAQVAANARGTEKLLKLVDTHGLTTVRNYMGFIRENAELAVKEVIGKLRNSQFSCEMDDGTKIAIELRVDREARTAVVDFSKSSRQVASNLNAPRSICRAAVLYVFRTLVEQAIPLNDGCLQPIEIIMPEGTIINPRFPAAVVAGNVETSQAVTDCLYGALGALAASQGTMNNFTFGNEKYQYYETICGGAGAGPDFDGASAVHTHMTNSRLTDPEVLELRFPVLLEEFCVRKHSGGNGKHRGGDGAVRRLRFLEPMTASILSQRRNVAPFGLSGGGPAAKGANYVVRANGERVELPGTASLLLNAGDVFVIETPGGGGYGSSET